MDNTLPLVKDVCDRKVLSEGRNYNMGFAFCKLMADGTFETIQPLSPCKDYLNDVIYSEHTGKPFSACGLNTKKTGIFEEQPHAFLAIKMLSPKGGGWPGTGSLQEAKDRLKKNYIYIETLLNHVEESFTKQGLIERTAISPTQDEDLFLLAVPLWWCRSTHLISLYSLLVRMGQFWNGEGDPQSFLENYKEPLDLQLWNPTYGIGAFTKYNRMLKFGVRVITPQEMDYGIENPNKPNIHGNGIINYP